MNLLIWIITGGIVGVTAGAALHMSKRTSQRKELWLNTVAGAVGALLGGSLLAPIFGTGSIDPQHYTNAKLIVAIASALALLIIVNAFGQFNKR